MTFVTGEDPFFAVGNRRNSLISDNPDAIKIVSRAIGSVFPRRRLEARTGPPDSAGCRLRNGAAVVDLPTSCELRSSARVCATAVIQVAAMSALPRETRLVAIPTDAEPGGQGAGVAEAQVGPAGSTALGSGAASRQARRLGGSFACLATRRRSPQQVEKISPLPHRCQVCTNSTYNFSFRRMKEEMVTGNFMCRE